MILLLVIIISAILLAAAVFKIYRQSKQFKKNLAAKNSELKRLYKIEEKFQQELDLLQTKLNHAIKDPLTQLQAWGLFESHVTQRIHESARYQFTMAVLYVDINDFKVINDALGYEIGDTVLNVVSQRLQANIRQVDSISRFSKDIFVILLTQLNRPETAALIAQRILESLTQPAQVKEHKLYISASIGISIYPNDGKDTQTLFRNADQALLLAKKSGRQNYHFYQEVIHENSLRELAIVTGLKRDSIIDELEIYYQPIMNVKTKTIFCMEALLCWRHPELGLIHSQDLFNYAERNGKLNTISELLLKEACKHFLHWRSIGFQPQLLGVFLSIKQLKNSQFIYRLSQILQECNFKPEWLLIEIKENLRQLTFENLGKTLNMLKYLNIQLAVDNFGTGQIPIQVLKNFTVNYLKLDQALIQDIAQNEQTKELVKALLVLAQSLSMQLIVQGVDSEQQLDILQELNCHLVQGHFIGAAVTEREVVVTPR